MDKKLLGVFHSIKPPLKINVLFKSTRLSDLSACAPYDPTQELIFPPELTVWNLSSARNELNISAETHRAQVVRYEARLVHLVPAIENERASGAESNEFLRF